MVLMCLGIIIIIIIIVSLVVGVLLKKRDINSSHYSTSSTSSNITNNITNNNNNTTVAYTDKITPSGGLAGEAVGIATMGSLMATEIMMRDDIVFDAALPPLKCMVQRPELVEMCYQIIAPMHILALVDIPVAKVVLHRMVTASAFKKK
eukprot:Tbor_TRINITY_DN5395_c7_g1::TRINITY_DN5395_c7_g1_i6::g.4932::m.4932